MREPIYSFMNSNQMNKNWSDLIYENLIQHIYNLKF